MQKFVPHLWFDAEALEAARLYCSTFPDSHIEAESSFDGTPSGEVRIVNVRLAGREFILMNAGPYFRFNPSVSFLAACDTKEEVDRIAGALGEGGSALMPLGAYPFSGRYAWVIDRFGVSWQVMLMGDIRAPQKITPTQMFVGEQCGKAEEALGLYTRVFGGAVSGGITRYGPGEEPDRPGSVKHASFTLAGEGFALMDSAYDHGFAFNEAISYMVRCDSQEEIDRYWAALSAVPDAEQCGWVKDRFGFSWQIVPREMDALMSVPDPAARDRVVKAMLGMKKLSIEGLRKAAAGG